MREPKSGLDRRVAERLQRLGLRRSDPPHLLLATTAGQRTFAFAIHPHTNKPVFLQRNTMRSAQQGHRRDRFWTRIYTALVPRLYHWMDSKPRA
jgi:hypothetical protein